MGISTQVSPVPSNVTPVPPRTFQWGERGTIEMRPIEEVAQSTLAPGRPQVQTQTQAELDILSADPRDIIQQQYERDLQQIENTLLTSKDTVTKKTRYKLAELEEERKLKESQIRRKFDVPLKEGETSQDRKRELQTALADLYDQIDLAKMRISSKIQPDIDMLDMQGQQLIQEQQQKYREQMRDLEFVDRLVEDGTIVDPAAAQQKKLQIAGINLPITGLREPQINWDTEQSKVSALIRQLEKFLSPENLVGFYSTETGEMVKPSDEEIENATNLLQAYKVYYNEMIMPNLFPQHREVYQQASKLGKAAEYARGRIVPATGEPVSTLGTEVAKVKEKTMPGRVRGMPVIDPLGVR